MRHILVLGAERQAASSIACAYPDRTVTFVSDHTILDGDDLPNVRMVFASPDDPPVLPSERELAPLCPRWLVKENPLPLSAIFEKAGAGPSGHHAAGTRAPNLPGALDPQR